MNLTELVATAAAGAADAPLPLDLAAALYAAVAEDRATMSLHAGPRTADMAVEISGTDDPEEYLAVVMGGLRYSLSLISEPMAGRLCPVRDCFGESVGRGMLTRPCIEHLGDLVVPGMLPNAADDIRPGDREAAARRSRTMRLDAWEEEARTALYRPQGDLRVINSLRAEAA